MRFSWTLVVALSLAGCTDSGTAGPVSSQDPDGEETAGSIDTDSAASTDQAPLQSLVLGASRGFGSNDEQCSSTTLWDWPEAETLLTEGQECFFKESNANHHIVWDLLSYTDEGDPIFQRHIYDGEYVWILGDDRADTYGAGRTSVLRCDGYGPTKSGLDGLGCKPSQYPGFTGFAEAD